MNHASCSKVGYHETAVYAGRKLYACPTLTPPPGPSLSPHTILHYRRGLLAITAELWYNSGGKEK